jgi:hypothetical protein
MAEQLNPRHRRRVDGLFTDGFGPGMAHAAPGRCGSMMTLLRDTSRPDGAKRRVSLAATISHHGTRSRWQPCPDPIGKCTTSRLVGAHINHNRPSTSFASAVRPPEKSPQRSGSPGQPRQCRRCRLSPKSVPTWSVGIWPSMEIRGYQQGGQGPPSGRHLQTADEGRARTLDAVGRIPH